MLKRSKIIGKSLTIFFDLNLFKFAQKAQLTQHRTAQIKRSIPIPEKFLEMHRPQKLLAIYKTQQLKISKARPLSQAKTV